MWALGLWSPHFSVVGVVSVWGLSPGAGSTAPTLRPFHPSPPISRPPGFCEGQFGHLFFPKRVTRIIQATYSQLIQAELVSDKDRGSSKTSVAQISQGEDKMTKRKKLRTSGDGLCPPKPLKNPRLGDSDGDPQSSMLGYLHHPEEPESKLGPVPSTQQHREEPGKAVSSSPDEETGSPCRLLRQPEKEPAPLPPSQETLPESSAQSPGCQLLVETLGAPLQDATEPGDPMQADSARPEQSSQSPVQAVPKSGDSQPDDPPDRGTGLSASQRASQDHLSEQGADDSKPETDRVPGDRGQKEHLPSSDSEGEKPDRVAHQEGGAQRTAGAGLPGGPQEEGDGVPCTPASAPTSGPAPGLSPASWCLEPGSVAQGSPDPQQTPSRMGREGEGTHSSLGCSSLGMVVIADLSTDPTELEERALEVAGPHWQASAISPASPRRQAADGGHRRALPGCTSLTGETTGESGEAGQDGKPPGDVPVGPMASLALASGSGESMMGAGDSGHASPDTGPCVNQKQEPGPAQEAAELGGQNLERDLEGLRVSPQASVLLEHRETADGPLQEPGAQQGIPDTTSDLAGQRDHLPHSADQGTWADSLAVELDFLLDSQIQDALDASDFEAPPEQLFPLGNKPGPCWRGPSPRASGDPVAAAKAQPRTFAGIQASEASRMEDATNVVRGLIVELSNLNRLIMGTHRDLEAFKRLNYRKTKPGGKAPLPYPSKGPGNVPRGDPPWREL
ncbi:break repair meiotic recombinase recruitment factor 1 isoform X4 [Symphalangus syndactylus]|uniref:break repair meiotic recombinase recruitment factor 1 isoform X4 n=1 Tax=Symphalangus syndactylus TaxID=9590 RepID=UPI002441CB5D|nr:break repair meiotic recombinase recruitment factor 1 isoform X3 [Symphalangus syndactylus]